MSRDSFPLINLLVDMSHVVMTNMDLNMTKSTKLLRVALNDQQLIQDIENAKFDYGLDERDIILEGLYLLKEEGYL